MKKLQYHPVTKTLCGFLAALMLFTAIVSAGAFLLLLRANGYMASWSDIKQNYLDDYYRNVPFSVVEQYVYLNNNNAQFSQWLGWMEEEYSFTCEIRNIYGSVLYSDHTEETPSYYRNDTLYFYTDLDGNVCSGYSSISTEYGVTIYGYAPEKGSAGELYLEVLQFCHRLRFLVLGTLFASLFLFVLLMILLCSTVGRREKDGEVRLGFWSRVPAEIVLGFWAAFLAFQLLFLDDIDRDVAIFVFSVAAAFLAVDSVLCVLSIANIAIRFKGKAFLENTLIWRLWKPCSKLLKKLVSFFASLWQEVRLEPKVVLILAAVAIFDFFLATFLSFTEFLAAVLMEGVILSVILVWYAAAIQLLHRDLSHRVEGKLEYRSDLSRLPPGLRTFGEDLNRSAEGMEKALEEKMRSERFKTELITGVSHDIKTPLTSIINYVDLMKKEETENEKIREYLEVLDRQSARLKKLTEDLVESSKAASGSLPIDLAPMDVKVLMEQVQGEYQSVLEEKGLIPVFNLPEEPVFILADGKRIWRVLDNLMNNIAKYALSGTRVYGDLIMEKGVAKIIFRNISAQPLPFSGEDLTEKFVRGDASRNTEGSGLGLAIAKSYVELQKGRFEVICDGDLFKVQISFDIIE